MKSKTLFILIALSFLLCVPVSNALAFSLGDYQGPVIMKFSNWDMGTVYNADGTVLAEATGQWADDEDAWGIYKITGMWAADSYGPNSTQVGPALWSDGDNGEEITGMFWGIHDEVVTIDDSPSFGFNQQIESSGGQFAFYLNDSGTLDASLGSGGRFAEDGYNTISNTGTEFFSGKMIPGIFYGDGDTTNDSNTFSSTFNNSSSIGSGGFYANVIEQPGDYSWLFNTNAMVLNNALTLSPNPGFDDSGNPVDNADFQAQFNANPTSTGDWLTGSFDPFRGGVIVPEPTTLVLLGFGLLSIAGIGRRRV